MTVAATALSGVRPLPRRVAPRGASRRVARGIAFGAGIAGFAVALAATATTAAVWMVATARPDNLSSSGVTARGPGALALAQFSPPSDHRLPRSSPSQASADTAGSPAATFDAKWALAAIPEPAGEMPPAWRDAHRLEPALTIKAKTARTKVAALAPASASAPAAAAVPLPRSRPAMHDVADATPPAPARKVAAGAGAPAYKVASAAPIAPVEKATAAPSSAPAQKLATAIPTAPAQKPVTPTPPGPAQKLVTAMPSDTTGSIPPTAPNREPPQPVLNKVTLPTPGSRVAVYDITARTVYLPNGEKLEAHSGLGDKMDDPRHVNVRMRGATPPNIYNLTLRESLFHGVAAIRLNPVHEDKMYGRDGILAHTYMLGPNGQSNGCVSFKNYAAFLRAFQKGEFDRLVVVAKMGDPMPDLDSAPMRTARATPVSRWRVADSQPAAATRQHALTGQW